MLLRGPYRRKTELSDVVLAILFAATIIGLAITILSGCVSNTSGKPEPDAMETPTACHGYRRCDEPYIPGDDCRMVCCEGEDWIGAPQDTHCAISGRKCTSPSRIWCLIGVTPKEPDGTCP